MNISYQYIKSVVFVTLSKFQVIRYPIYKMSGLGLKQVAAFPSCCSVWVTANWSQHLGGDAPDNTSLVIISWTNITLLYIIVMIYVWVTASHHTIYYNIVIILHHFWIKSLFYINTSLLIISALCYSVYLAIHLFQDKIDLCFRLR